MKKLFILVLMGIALVACTDYSDDYTKLVQSYHKTIILENGKFTDERDGNRYAVVQIGDMLWMAENLRYADSSKTKNLKGNVWCYDNKADSCSKYGPLYSWTAAMDIESKYISELNGTMYNQVYEGICPEGWRLPSTKDWESLKKSLNGMVADSIIGASIKSITGWIQGDSATRGMNRFGFNAMPAGRRNSESGDFMSTGKYAFFWTSDEKDVGTGRGWGLRYDWDKLDEGFYYKDHGMSVRCVTKDENAWLEGEIDSTYLDEIPFEYGVLEFEGRDYRTIKIGSQNWMAENMDFKTDESWCYNDDSENCKKYGRLYSFEQAEKVCPTGWHLPSHVDASLLMSYVHYVGSTLRSREGWTEKGSKGWNLWGFNAFPAGGRETGDFFDVALSAYMWIDDQTVMWLRYYSNEIELIPKGSGTAFSVRCVED